MPQKVKKKLQWSTGDIESFGPTKWSTLEVLNNRFLSPMNVTNQWNYKNSGSKS